MKSIKREKLVLFGAGKIGRSFIGQLFSNGGYEVVFIDISEPLIDEINRKGRYRIIIKGEEDHILNIENVRGVHLLNEPEAIDEVATAGILATSVGLAGLKGIFPVLAKGLLKRYMKNRYHPLDIIIAENMRNADEYFREHLLNLLPPEYPFGPLVGLIETSIGKMVPIMHKKDIEADMLQIFAEPYNTLILNKKGFRNAIPDIKGLAPKENMKAWVDRKLFIHNLGHSASAYLGYLYNKDFIYLWESLGVPGIQSLVRSAMLQAAEILKAGYPGEFTNENLTEHIDDLITRFQNKALGDTIFRVGCDLNRKLGPEDRLSGAIHKALAMNLPYDRILFPLVAGCYFRASDEEGVMFIDDIDFMKKHDDDIIQVLISVCGFDRNRHKAMFTEASSMDAMIRDIGLKGSIISLTGKTLKHEK
jgi:mannitol-1-phosphate 5-dehydrogenase